MQLSHFLRGVIRVPVLPFIGVYKTLFGVRPSGHENQNLMT